MAGEAQVAKGLVAASNPLLGLADSALGALGTAFASPPSTAVSGASPNDFKNQTFNIAPQGVNLGEILKVLQSGGPETGGIPLNVETLQTSSLSRAGDLLGNPLNLALIGALLIGGTFLLRKKAA